MATHWTCNVLKAVTRTFEQSFPLHRFLTAPFIVCPLAPDLNEDCIGLSTVIRPFDNKAAGIDNEEEEEPPLQPEFNCTVWSGITVTDMGNISS